MLRRCADVVLESAVRVGLLTLAVIALAGTLGFELDRTQTITARAWVDTSPLSVYSVTRGTATASSPAATDAVVIRELMASDAFLDRVLIVAWAGYREAALDQRDRTRTSVRSHLQVDSFGAHTLTVVFRTSDPATGLLIAERVLVEANASIQADQPGQLRQRPMAAGELQDARRAVDSAAAAVDSYVKDHHGAGGTAPTQDPEYLRLSAEANVKSSIYLELLARLDATQAGAGQPTDAFRIVDAAQARPTPFDSSSLAFRLAGVALVSCLALAALIAYVTVLRDPRLRDRQDASRLPGLVILGSVPLR